MKTVTLSKIEQLANAREIYYDDRHARVFDNIPGYDLCVAGSTVTISFEKKGKYWNVTKIEQGTAQQSVEQDKSGKFANATNERQSIERQKSLDLAERFWNRTELKPSEWKIKTLAVLGTAEMFYEWISHGIYPEPDEPQTVRKEPSVPPEGTELITEAQKKKLGVLVREKGLPEGAVSNFIFMEYNKVNSKELTKKEASDLISAIETGRIKAQ